MLRLRLVLTGLLVLLALPVAARAAWSRPVALDHVDPRGADEPAPRIAVNGHGSSVTAWVDSHGRVRIAAGDAHGRFGRSKNVGTGLRPSVAIDDDGRAIVVFRGNGGLRIATRPAGDGA